MRVSYNTYSVHTLILINYPKPEYTTNKDYIILPSTYEKKIVNYNDYKYLVTI